jgi:trans-2,3-dihydro-3-hydroxyanthranilate isomerase
VKRRYVTADVFTDKMFGGNPVAVVLDAAGLTTAQMQAIALEFNYSETTFVLPARDPVHTAQVRIFTSRTEVPFAGHPNVGTAYLLAREFQLQGTPHAEQFVFEEAAGLVPLTLLKERGATVGAELRAPEFLTRRTVISRQVAASCLSLSPLDILLTTHDPQIISVGLPFLVFELGSRDALRRAKPNLMAYEALLPLDGADAVFAYVREKAAAGPGNEAVLYARMFSPLDGIVEDPATGSATAATIALLATIDRDAGAERRWRIHQGVEMGRASLLLGRTVLDDASSQVTVYVGGHCVAVLRGSFEL